MAVNQALLFPMVVFQLFEDTIQTVQVNGPATASFTVNSAGTVSIAGSSLFGVTYPYNWKTPTSGSTGFFVRATLLSESGNGITSGTFDTWLATTSNRSWAAVVSAGQEQSVQTLVEIARDSGGNDILAEAQIDLFATGL